MTLEEMNKELLEEVTSLRNQNLNLSKKNKELKKQLTLTDVIVPKGTLLFHLKALTKKIEDSHCYGFEDILKDYIKSNAL